MEQINKLSDKKILQVRQICKHYPFTDRPCQEMLWHLIKACDDKKVIMIQPRIARLQNFSVLVRATQSGKSVQVFLCEINFVKMQLHHSE